jgi:hypothetical protein
MRSSLLPPLRAADRVLRLVADEGLVVASARADSSQVPCLASFAAPIC